ncbi:MAG TPA: lipoate--protein ligase family protein [Leptospiraceae bacterium]|nr:lipoate--protein ligase family protein [Leptospiraceae bacterium]
MSTSEMPIYFCLNEKKIKNPYWNLALEEALALEFCKNSYSLGLRFWRNPLSAVLGISDEIFRNLSKESLESAHPMEIPKDRMSVEKKGMYVCRRASGGGTVYHDSYSNLNYTVFLNLEKYPEFFPVQKSYETILNGVISSLLKQGIKAEMSGKSDLCMGTESGFKKISGNSQFRKRGCLVQHGTLILKKELIDKVESFLLHPPAEPEYRKGRKHTDFLTAVPKTFHSEKFQMDMESFFLDQLSIQNAKKVFSCQYYRTVRRSLGSLLQSRYANKDFIFSR